VTVNTDDANRQHYELPPEFFGLVLGPRRKYSSC
jgi:cyclopropane-fatty-acyl-phospholipid synthase